MRPRSIQVNSVEMLRLNVVGVKCDKLILVMTSVGL